MSELVIPALRDVSIILPDGKVLEAGTVEVREWRLSLPLNVTFTIPPVTWRIVHRPDTGQGDSDER